MENKALANKSGNLKLGNMWTFNKTAGSGTLLGCKGSCDPKYCNGACYNVDNPQKSNCYVFKSYVRYGFNKETNSVIKCHNRNTIAIREDINKAFESIREQLRLAKVKPLAYRIHSSGELETPEELIMWIETAKMFPMTEFYIYTKAFDVVNEALGSIDQNYIPSNWHMNISIWHESGLDVYNKWKHLPSIRAFIYDDGEYDYSELGVNCHCPAYRKDENGKVKLHHDITCDKCKICYSNKNKVCACLNH